MVFGGRERGRRFWVFSTRLMNMLTIPNFWDVLRMHLGFENGLNPRDIPILSPPIKTALTLVPAQKSNQKFSSDITAFNTRSADD